MERGEFPRWLRKVRLLIELLQFFFFFISCFRLRHVKFHHSLLNIFLKEIIEKLMLTSDCILCHETNFPFVDRAC